MSAALLLLACGSPPAATSAESPAPDNAAQNAAPTPTASASAAPDSSAPSQPSTEPSPPAPAGTPTLPAVTVRNVGLHVGGGPNDAQGKAPFLSAIEQRFPDLLSCYKLVNEPGSGGTFGLDLRIARAGGHPTVDKPRTVLGDERFHGCMVKAFESVEFPALKRDTVISYSVRFSVEQ